MPSGSDPAASAVGPTIVPPATVSRYVPLVVWVIVALTLIIIPAKIIGYGYLPADDALRHAAKAVSGKPWNEILVMRPDFGIDPHPGWHAILGLAHRLNDLSTERLVVCGICGLMIFFQMAPLPWFRRPEAWVAASLFSGVFLPMFMRRLALGRPFVFTMAAGLFLLLLWSRETEKKYRWLSIAASVLLVALASWIHGSFYQLVLPGVALALAGRWRTAFIYGLCWVAGSFLGAAFTGHPIEFLLQCLHHLRGVFGDFLVARQLVMEIMPGDGDYPALVGIGLLLLWRSRSKNWSANQLRDPLLIIALMGWLLGLKMLRFWWDWGIPAMLVWIGLQLEQEFKERFSPESLKRIVLTGILAVGLFWSVTGDRDSRWTYNLTNEYLEQSNPELTGWLPGPGGIMYSADMRVFNDTFFKNPTAPWRYVLGFEPALMLPEDLAVYRKVQWNFGDVRAYEPWVHKMHPEDRLVLRASWLHSPGAPAIPELEWKYAVTDIWIGRLPRAAK